MEKRIDFLQSPSGHKKKKGGRDENDNVAWTSPGPALILPEEKKKKGFGELFKGFGFKKKDKPKPSAEIKNYKTDIKINELYRHKKEKLKEKKEIVSEEVKEAAVKEEKASFAAKISQYLKSIWPKKKQFLPEKEQPKIELKPPKEDFRENFTGKIDLAKSLKKPAEKEDKPKTEKAVLTEKYELKASPNVPDAGGSDWSADNFKGTNLIKEKIGYKELKKRGAVTLSLVLAAVIFILSANYAITLWAETKVEEKKAITSQLERIAQDKNNKRAELKDIFLFEKRLRIAKILIDRHIYYTSFFDFLEDNTLESVYFSNFLGDTKGEYTLSATAKDYKNITKQIDVFREDDMVKEASTMGGNLGKDGSSKEGREEAAGGVNFSLKLILDKKIFNKLTN